MIERLNALSCGVTIHQVAMLVKDENSYYGSIDPAHFTGVVQQALSAGYGRAYGLTHAGRPVGLLFGLLVPDGLTGQLMALEYLWVVAKSYRRFGGALKLLKEFEKDARAVGAEILVCGSSAFNQGEKLRKLYARLGFRPHAEAFSKVL
jgi:GNAT superfamily N-acetyltransferase